MSYALIFVALFLLFAPPAHAYIDACTGSYMVQLVFGTVLSLLIPLQRTIKKFTSIRKEVK
jgi:hypothetical protein